MTRNIQKKLKGLVLDIKIGSVKNYEEKNNKYYYILNTS